MDKTKKNRVIVKRISKTINKIDKFFDDQTGTPTPREYSNFIADIQHELKKMLGERHG